MSVSYIDKVLYLYPGIQGVMFWHGDPVTGSPFSNAYDGLQWNNTSIMQPTQATLDAIPDATVEAAQAATAAAATQSALVAQYSSDLGIKQAYITYQSANPTATISDYITYLNNLPLPTVS